MIIDKIIINNFGVYGGKNEFNFKTTPEQTVILCGGTNGAGKTTLFESIMLCFYGKEAYEFTREKEYHTKILRSFHRNLGTKISANTASITIEFEFAIEGKIREYQITRSWENNNGKVNEELSIKKLDSGDEDFKKLDVTIKSKKSRWENEKFEEIDAVEKSEWQSFINQLIPKGIAKLFFFDGEKIQSIADEGEENKYIQSSFDTLLGLDIVNQLNKDVGLMLSRSEKSKTDTFSDNLKILLKDKEELDGKIKRIKEEQIELKEEIKSLKIELSKEEEKFQKIGGRYYDKREKFKADEEKLESKITLTEKEIRDFCSTILPFSLIPEELDEIKKQIYSDQQTMKSNYEKEILEKKYQKLSSLVKSESFLPKISNEIKNKVVLEIDSILNSDLNSLQNNSETYYNFSPNGMEQIITLIDNAKKSSIVKIRDLTDSYKIQKNVIDKIEITKNIAPKNDEIEPVFNAIRKLETKKGKLEERLENSESLWHQMMSKIKLLNSEVRICLSKKHDNEKMSSSEKIARQVMIVLEEYTQSLRDKKLTILEDNILKGLQILLHKKDFVDKVSINRETFEVKLYKGKDDEITKNMLSKGELQIYATAVVWGLAITSGRPLPFMIDTPLARLDEEHRLSLVENFFPGTSQQTIILSTDSEINFEYYDKLKPYISKSYTIDFDSSKGKTTINDGYFFDNKGEMTVEVH